MSNWGKGSAGPRGPYRDWDLARDDPIKRARKVLKLTQQEAAAELGVPRSTLAKWESGHATAPKWGKDGDAIKAFVARARAMEKAK